MASNGKLPGMARRAAWMVLMGLAMPLAAHAQTLDEIRAEQRRLALETGIAMEASDDNGRLTSQVGGLLPELRDLVVENEQQLIDAVIPSVYQYFGVTGTGAETLRFQGKSSLQTPNYYFQEYINGIEAPGGFFVFVDPSSNKVINSAGALEMDKGYARVPAMSEQDALDLVLAFIRERNEQFHFRQNDPDNITAIESLVVYLDSAQGLEPSWQFLVPALDTAEPFLDEYLVSPDGRVIGGVRGM